MKSKHWKVQQHRKRVARKAEKRRQMRREDRAYKLTPPAHLRADGWTDWRLPGWRQHV